VDVTSLWGKIWQVEFPLMGRGHSTTVGVLNDDGCSSRSFIDNWCAVISKIGGTTSVSNGGDESRGGIATRTRK